MNTKVWNLIRIIIATAGIAVIIYVLATSWNTMTQNVRFVRVATLVVFLVYLVSAVLRYRKGSDVSGS